MDKYPFSSTEHMAWVLCLQTCNAIQKCQEKSFRKTGLTPQQYLVLLAMKYISEPVTPTAVAHWIERSTNTVTLIIDRMEQDGLVERMRDLEDRRALRLVTTKKGKELFDRARGPASKLIQKIMGSLSRQELQDLSRLLERVRDRALDCLYEAGDAVDAQPKETRPAGVLQLAVAEPRGKTKYRAPGPINLSDL